MEITQMWNHWFWISFERFQILGRELIFQKKALFIYKMEAESCLSNLTYVHVRVQLFR